MDLEDDTSWTEFRFVRDCFDYVGCKRQSEDRDSRVSHFRRRFDQSQHWQWYSEGGGTMTGESVVKDIILIDLGLLFVN